MKNYLNKHRIKSMRLEAGLSMVELMIWALIAGIIVAFAVKQLGTLRGGINAGNMGEKAMYLAMDIQKHWNAVNDYSSVSADEVNKLGLVKSPLKYDAGQLYDGYGNQMSLNGSRLAFAMTIGGAAAPMDKDDCATIVGRLEAVSTSIRVGASAAANAGVISGGTVYKSGATLDQTGLTTGCSEAGAKIAIQVR